MAGCRVLITRPAHQAGSTFAALEQAGADVVLLPLIRIDPPDDPEPLRQAARRVWAGEFDWVVVTSANGAEALARALREARQEPAPPHPHGEPPARLCAVGPATREALEREGLRVACTPERAQATAVPDALERAGPLAGRRVLLALGDRAAEGLGSELARRGAAAERVTAYCTRDDPEAARRAAELVCAGEVDLVLAASPSAVQALAGALARGPGKAWSGSLTGSQVWSIAIGPTTAGAARAAGWRVFEAASPNAEALAAACAQAWQQKRKAAEGEGGSRASGAR